MKYIFTVLCLIATSLTFAQQTGKSHIKGHIQTSDGKPGSFVTVQIKNSKTGTVTDENGNYQLRNVSAGNHTLVISIVGFESTEYEIETNEDATLTVADISLKEDAKTLREVTVKGNINKFAQKESPYVSRLPLKNLENPQVYSVISKDLMEEQLVTDYKQSLRNVPGAAVAHGGYSNGFTYSVIRGFWTGARMRNGLSSQQFNGIDPVTVERTEAIKGPSGTLFGSSLISFGGLTNLVTKKPLDTFQGNVTFTTGSYDLVRLAADVNTPLNADKSLLLRVNTALHSEGSFMDWGFQKRFVFAPSLSYKVDDRLTLNFEAEILRSKMTLLPIQDFSGVSVKDISKLPIRYNQSINSDDPVNSGGSDLFYAQATYRLPGNWTSNTLFSYAAGHDDEFVALWASWKSDSTIARNVETAAGGTTDLQFQQNFNGEFKIAGMRNRLIVGLDYYHTKNISTGYVNASFASQAAYDVINTNRLYSPVSLDKIRAIRSNLIHARQSSKTETYSAYASNVLNITDRLLAMLSLRIDRYEYKGAAVMFSDYTDGYGQTALSPKLGLVYQPVKDQVSIFANYMNGFQNNGSARQPDGSISVLKPANGYQWETGVKLDVFNHKLSATVSYYNIDLTNAIRQDASGFSRQDGKQRSKGIEADIIANPFPGLSIIAGFGMNDYEYLIADEGQAGTTTGLPKDFVNFWISYKAPAGALRGVGVGFGGNYVSEANSDNQYGALILPSYTLLDATVFYDKPKWRLAFKVNNLSNAKMWGLNNNPLNPRNVATSLSFKF